MARRKRTSMKDAASGAFTKARAALWFAVRSVSVLLLVGAAAALIIGRPILREHVASQRADPIVVRFAWPLISPTDTQSWLPFDERDRLEQMVLARVSTDPFDTASLDEARAALEQTGWFDRVRAVRRLPAGVIEVDAQWRAPAAVVRYAGRDMLVSMKGELLPLTFPVGGAWPLRAVTGVRAGPPPRTGGGHDFGAAWAGGDVQVAIELLAYLRRSAAWDKVAAIDATDFFRKGWLTIISTENAEIVWGSPPGAHAPGEQDDERKLLRLDAIFRDGSWISAGMPRVELYGPYVFIDERASGG